MADTNDTVWIAAIGGVVVGIAIAGIYVAYQSGWFNQFTAQSNPQIAKDTMLQNRETIRWQDSKGRMREITVDREVVG